MIFFKENSYVRATLASQMSRNVKAFLFRISFRTCEYEANVSEKNRFFRFFLGFFFSNQNMSHGIKNE